MGRLSQHRNVGRGSQRGCRETLGMSRYFASTHSAHFFFLLSEDLNEREIRSLDVEDNSDESRFQKMG